MNQTDLTLYLYLLSFRFCTQIQLIIRNLRARIERIHS